MNQDQVIIKSRMTSCEDLRVSVNKSRGKTESRPMHMWGKIAGNRHQNTTGQILSSVNNSQAGMLVYKV